jgi:hypothetical protein
MELNIFAKAKGNSPSQKGNAEVTLHTTMHNDFKTVKLTGTDQNGNPIKVTVFMDVKQPLKKLKTYAFNHKGK